MSVIDSGNNQWRAHTTTARLSLNPTTGLSRTSRWRMPRGEPAREEEQVERERADLTRGLLRTDGGRARRKEDI